MSNPYGMKISIIRVIDICNWNSNIKAGVNAFECNRKKNAK
jgi:hypothetical protein